MESNSKLFSIILLVLLGGSAVLSLLFAFSMVSEGMLITWCYILLGVASVTAVVFPLITMAKNPAGAKNALIGVVVLVVISAIAYTLAGNESYIDYEGVLLADEATSQLSEAALIVFYILGAGAIGSIVFAEVSKMFK
jgi:lysylphosphatidylglycerol synthetase-like protein (DUF2156 family)